MAFKPMIKVEYKTTLKELHHPLIIQLVKFPPQSSSFFNPKLVIIAKLNGLTLPRSIKDFVK
jgi:hypothetical protein